MKALKSYLHIVTCGAVWVLLSGSSSCSVTPPATVDVTILHTNDIHSHLRAEPFNSEKNPFNLGGLARLKTLVNSLRATKPNSILLDAGDWSEGTSYFDADGGSNMLKIMSSIGYNAAVVGNHDFLDGPSVLGNTIEAAQPTFPVLGANKDLSALAASEQTRLNNDIVPSTIITVAGIKIGIIGLLCDDFFYYGYFSPGVITNPVTTATAIANTMHDQKLADVIVLLSHNTFSSNVAWAQSVPWVNVVISGHSHFKTPQPIATTNGGNPAYIAETKSWGQFLGDMTLTVTPSTGQVVLKSYTLHPVTADLAEDPTVAALVSAQDTALATRFGKDINDDEAVEAADEMVQDDTREVPLTNLTADAYRAATGADIALESVQLNGVGIQPGPLSTMDVMNIAPHIFHPVAGQAYPQTGSTWTLKKLPVAGSVLRGLLNVTFLADSLGLVGWIAESGAKITWSSSSTASPIQSIQILNPLTGAYEDLNDNTIYQVAFHDGLLTAINILISKLDISLDMSQLQETGIEAKQAVLNFVTPLGTLHASDYLPGTRYNALGTDLAFWNSDVQVVQTGSAYALNVTVHNIGLTASTAGAFSLQVLRSPPNDSTNDFSYSAPDETIAIGPTTPVPTIEPGESAVVQIPWTNLAGSGIYGLAINLLGQADANPVNASLIHHAHVGVP